MQAGQQKKQLFDFITNFILWLFLGATFAVIWYGNYSRVFYVRGNYAIITMYALFVYFITKTVNGYNNSYMRASDRVLSHIIAVLLSGLIGYIFICIAWRKYVSLAPTVRMVLVQLVFAVCWTLLVSAVSKKLFPPNRIVLVYGSYPPERFLDKLKKRSDRYEVVSVLNAAEGLQAIFDKMKGYDGVVLYDLQAETRNEIMKECFRSSVSTYTVPKISDILLEGSESFYLLDTPLYFSENKGLRPDERFLKRLGDIIFSLIGLVIASPFMLITAICVKCYDRGPVFYKQIRLTRDGKTFSMLKFRSMAVNAEQSGIQLAQKGDDRITPVGRVIRNLHFDELPQLFNILKGDMSMVGPRPERPEIFEKIREDIPEFDFRLKVKAGLTGYAQVYGRYSTAPIDKLKLDVTYIRQFSYWLDLKLILLTVRLLFFKEYAEGVEKNDRKDDPLP